MRAINSKMIVLLSAVALVATGCKGAKGDKGDPGTPGTGGQQSLVKLTTEPAGANCAAGGQKVEVGIDANGNGVLDTNEVSPTATTYICNGANGSGGSSGQNALVNTTPEPVGANCAAGGTKIEVGLDADRSGTLDAGEITSTRYTCNGIVGPPGQPPLATVENCAGCHDAQLPAKHAPRNDLTVSNVVISGAAADIVITYNVKVDGVNRNDFTNLVGVYSWVWSGVSGSATRTALTTTGFTLVSDSSGNYTLTLPGYGATGATPALFDSTSFLVRADNGATAQPQATLLAHYTTGNVMAGVPVNNQACMNCHGNRVFSALDSAGNPVGHHGANPVGAEPCAVCHDRDNTAETRLVALGSRLQGYVHGIHNSHNMPGAQDVNGVALPGGVYYLNGDATRSFSIGFPGYMNNCSTCHFEAALPTIAASPVSWRTCMSCHIGPPTTVGTQTVAAGWAWAGFGVANTGTAAAPIFLFGGVNHANFTAATVCANCHDGTTAPATLAGFHNGLLTERSGLLWDGADQSVVLGATVDMQITGATVNGTNLEIAWTATASGAPVNPCNASFASGPVFFGNTGVTGVCNNTPTGCASNLSILRAYAQANDWVNAGIGTSPGQPASAVNVTATNTTCAANVATTVVPVGTTFGTKGVVAIQGKPQMIFPGTGNVIQIRAKSPTREFVVGTGALPAASALRRAIVSTDKCDSCHKGTLYQHGGNRVDNVDLCVMCHNPAANEKNNRVNMGVTAGEAYDGKAGETYDMRTMVHAIHSAGETGRPLVYYRTNGVYFFGTKDALAKVANWPGTGCQVVAGSGAPGTATGAQCDTANTTAVTKTHNFIEVHYPRPLNDCSACHVDGWSPSTVDPRQGVAVTFDAGGTTYGNQLDDVLLGPTAASCMSCHQSGEFITQFGLRKHAYEQGWTPSVFANGRQTLLDAVTLP